MFPRAFRLRRMGTLIEHSRSWVELCGRKYMETEPTDSDFMFNAASP